MIKILLVRIFFAATVRSTLISYTFHPFCRTGSTIGAGKSARGDVESEPDTFPGAGPEMMPGQMPYGGGSMPSQYGPSMYGGGGGGRGGGGGMGGGQASTYGAPSFQAEDPFAEIYSEEMARNGMPIQQ